jgi:hypothetical protein
VLKSSDTQNFAKFDVGNIGELSNRSQQQVRQKQLQQRAGTGASDHAMEALDGPNRKRLVHKNENSALSHTELTVYHIVEYCL